MRHRRIPSILVLALALIATPAPARAVFPGEPGLIVFSDRENIFTIAPDGSPPLSQLTFNGDNENPRWSANGHRIVFDHAGDIYVMSATGRNVRRLTFLGNSFQPAWAPGGNRIVFVHQRRFGIGGDLWVVPTAGGTPTRLTFQNRTSCEIAHPTWSPLGGRVAYERAPRDAEGLCTIPTRVEVMRLDPRGRVVIPDARQPDFTADGHGLFFDTLRDPEGLDHNLAWSDLHGDQRERLTSYVCAEGEACFIEGVGSPASAFPDAPSFAVLESHLGGTLCLVTTSSGGFCDDVVPATPFQMDWQAVVTG
jgi:dipeptidyl aminopeptidase/acylaminoacyl peptidase